MANGFLIGQLLRRHEPAEPTVALAALVNRPSDRSPINGETEELPLSDRLLLDGAPGRKIGREWRRPERVVIAGRRPLRRTMQPYLRAHD